MRNSLHEATIAKEYPGPVIDNLVIRSIKLGGQHLLGYRHANGIGQALPQRASRRLDRSARFIFRVTGSPGSELAEILELVDRKIFVACQVQQAVEQH